jgi:VanZ family protein
MHLGQFERQGGAALLAAAAKQPQVAAVDKEFKALRIVALVLIVAASVYGLQRITAPYDKLHVIEYSILAFLLFRVLRFYNQTTALYLWCMIFTASAGCVDEYVQQYIPGRCSSLSDLRTDAAAGMLACLSIMLVICPELERWRLKMDFLQKELHERARWVDTYRSKRRALKDRHG